jgi:hypothetical protein
VLLYLEAFVPVCLLADCRYISIFLFPNFLAPFSFPFFSSSIPINSVFSSSTRVCIRSPFVFLYRFALIHYLSIKVEIQSIEKMQRKHFVYVSLFFLSTLQSFLHSALRSSHLISFFFLSFFLPCLSNPFIRQQRMMSLLCANRRFLFFPYLSNLLLTPSDSVFFTYPFVFVPFPALSPSASSSKGDG